jgi:prephenate dehydrogenase
VKNVTAKCVTLKSNDEITLKISNVDILSEKEVFEWKKDNIELENFDLTVQLHSGCSEKYLIKMFENIEPVIGVEITNIAQIDDSLMNFTFNYSVFNKEDKIYVEEYVRGIGWRFECDV